MSQRNAIGAPMQTDGENETTGNEGVKYLCGGKSVGWNGVWRGASCLNSCAVVVGGYIRRSERESEQRGKMYECGFVLILLLRLSCVWVCNRDTRSINNIFTRTVNYFWCHLYTDCAHENVIKYGDPIQCRKCGYRIMYKVRTGRLVQFECSKFYKLIPSLVVTDSLTYKISHIYYFLQDKWI